MGFEKDREEFGKRLKMARNGRGLKSYEAANLAGVTKSALSRYESGKRVPSQEVLKKLASAYKVSLDFLSYGTFNVYAHPNQLMIDLDTGIKEVSKEEYDMTRKLLIEKVKQVMSEKIETLEPDILLGLLDLDEDLLRAISYISKSSLESSIKSMNYSNISNLNKVASFIDENKF